ncbi:hypothetical protein ACFPRL_31200 [Pseudoclavibacter helvolus]
MRLLAGSHAGQARALGTPVREFDALEAPPLQDTPEGSPLPRDDQQLVPELVPVIGRGRRGQVRESDKPRAHPAELLGRSSHLTLESTPDCPPWRSVGTVITCLASGHDKAGSVSPDKTQRLGSGGDKRRGPSRHPTQGEDQRR